VHRGKVSHVLEKHRAAHDFSQAATRSIEDGRQILEHAVGLRGHIAGDDLLRRWIDRDLPRSKHEAGGANRLRVRPNGLGSLFGRNHIAHGASSSCAGSRIPDDATSTAKNLDYEG